MRSAAICGNEVAIAQIESKLFEPLSVNVKRERPAPMGTDAGRERPVGRKRT
jgi:hypothetical protein